MQEFTPNQFREAFSKLTDTEKDCLLRSDAAEKKQAFLASIGHTGNIAIKFGYLMTVLQYHLITPKEFTLALLTELNISEVNANNALEFINALKNTPLPEESDNLANTFFTPSGDTYGNGVINLDKTETPKKEMANSSDHDSVITHKTPHTSTQDSVAPAPTPAPAYAPSEVGSVVSAFRSARKDGSPVLIDALLSIQKTGAVSLGNTSIEQALIGFWNATPTSIKNAIVDQEYKHAVRNALLGHVLSPEEVATLEEEVVMTLMGMQRKEDFAKNLITHVKGLTSNDAANVTTHIDERFFALLSPFLTPITPQTHISETPPPVSPVAKAMGTKSPLEQFINTQPDVQTRFYKLPEEVRDVILSPEVATIFSETVRTHNLTQTQFIAYGKEVVRVMVGLATTKDFRTHVADLAVVSKESEDVFVRSVEQGMFKPVRDAIIRALEEKRSNG